MNCHRATKKLFPCLTDIPSPQRHFNTSLTWPTVEKVSVECYPLHKASFVLTDLQVAGAMLVRGTPIAVTVATGGRSWQLGRCRQSQ